MATSLHDVGGMTPSSTPTPSLMLLPAVNDAPEPAAVERARRNGERQRLFHGPSWAAPAKQTHIA